MKTLLIIALTVLSTNAFASTYCRTVQTGGLGQPVGEREHCLSFTKDFDGVDILVDNARTFFGNPPETKLYRSTGDGMVIEVLNGGQWESTYSVNYEGTIVINKTGSQVFLLK